MRNTRYVLLKEQIEKRILKGDYVTLGKMLEISQDTARMRFKRSNKQAIDAMTIIIENRDRLITDYIEERKKS